jgi:polysaccharide export outer membrane protein
LTDKAERTALHVLRRSGGQEETVPVKLDSLVLPDDIIVIAEGQKFFVSGEVKAPGRYLYEKGLTIRKALGLAGGRSDRAEKATVKLIRAKDGASQPSDLDLDVPVEPDDIIVVPELKKVYVDGEVKRAGDYPYERGLTVHKAITMAGGFTDKAAVGNTKILRNLNGLEQTIPATLDGVVFPEDILVVPRSFF